MGPYMISEAATRSGFSPSTLRFYEESGLVCPTRTASGYRTYDDRNLLQLRFVDCARRVGLPLEQIAALLALDRQGRQGAVQNEVCELVQQRLHDFQTRSTELLELTSRLCSFGRPSSVDHEMTFGAR